MSKQIENELIASLHVVNEAVLNISERLLTIPELRIVKSLSSEISSNASNAILDSVADCPPEELLPDWSLYTGSLDWSVQSRRVKNERC